MQKGPNNLMSSLYLEWWNFSGDWARGCGQESDSGGPGGNHAGCCHHTPGTRTHSYKKNNIYLNYIIYLS